MHLYIHGYYCVLTGDVCRKSTFTHESKVQRFCQVDFLLFPSDRLGGIKTEARRYEPLDGCRVELAASLRKVFTITAFS